MSKQFTIDPNHEDSQMTNEQWLAVRKDAGLKIDPETAEVFWEHGSVRDPYYLFEHGDDWEDNIGRNYFARSPGSDVWVWFGDLPDAIRDALWEKHKSRLAFPAGIFDFPLIFD
jgi:hypothetical protein